MDAPIRGRVLLVEDKRQAKVQESRLAKAGFETQRASGEAAALGLASEKAFDVIVVDVEIPGLDATSLIGRLRMRGSGAAVVWLTARITNELAAMAAEAGVLQVLRKPAEPKALERVVVAGTNQTRHLLSTFRTILRPGTSPRSVSATDAKNEFGNVLEAAVQGGAVVITKHDTAKAVLVSVERVNALLARHEPDLESLSREFDEMTARMRTHKARAAARALFAATPRQLGEAAVAGAKRRRG